MATYKTNWESGLSLNAIAGLNVNERKYNWLSGAINSIDVPGFYNLRNSRSPSVSNQRKEQRRLVGLYLNADLGYKDFAYLTLTARNDWSSTLPQNNNSYFYPGATFSFLITDFLQTSVFASKIADLIARRDSNATVFLDFIASFKASITFACKLITTFVFLRPQS